MAEIPGYAADEIDRRTSRGDITREGTPQQANIAEGMSPGDFSSRDAYQAEMNRVWDQDRANRAASQGGQANPFMSARAPGYAEQSNRINNMQASLIDPEAMGLARSAALGNQPSRAEELLRGGFGRGMAAARAQSATGRGNAYLAQRDASTSMGNMAGQIASESAALRADEMAAARGDWLQYDAMNRDAINKMTTAQANEFNILLANGWSYDQALREVAVQNKNADLAWRQMVLNDIYNRQLEEIPYDPNSMFPQHLYGRSYGPNDMNYGQTSSGSSDSTADGRLGRTATLDAEGNVISVDYSGEESGGPSARSYEFDETGGPGPEPGYRYSGFSTLSDEQKEEAAARDYAKRGGEDPFRDPSGLGTGLVESDPGLKGKAEKVIKDTTEAQNKALRIIGYLDKGQRIAESAYTMADGTPREAQSARKDLMGMGASELGNMLISKNLSGSAATGAAGALGFGIDAARIASERGSPKRKREALGKSAVGAGAGTVGAIAGAPLGPLGSAALGSASSAAAQKLYDYLMD